jgi:hypothetical protein
MGQKMALPRVKDFGVAHEIGLGCRCPVRDSNRVSLQLGKAVEWNVTRWKMLLMLLQIRTEVELTSSGK